MNIIESIKNRFGRPRDVPDESDKLAKFAEKTASIPLDRDDDGNLMYTEDVCAYIDSELERRKNERQPLELQWQLNYNFLMGNQYCDINLVTHEIETYEAAQPWMQHEVFNRIAPLIETRLAHLQKVTYAMTVKPRTDDLDDLDKADVSTAILRYIQASTAFESRKNTALYWSELTGTAFFMSWWDPNASTSLSREKTAGDIVDGDLAWGVLSPYEVYPESIYKQDISDQSSVIVDQVMTSREIYSLYGVKVKGHSVDAVSIAPDVAAGGFGYESTVMTMTHRTVDDAEHVVTYFERPSRLRPNGRMAIKIGANLVYYGDLVYGDIPIVMLRSKALPGMFYGRSVIQDLIPLQRSYNGVKNSLHDYIKMLSLGGYIAEDGSIDVDEYAEKGTEPGGILTYRKGFNPPTPRTATNRDIPSALPGEIQQLQSDMEYVSGVSQLMMVGGTPTGVQSGKAIEQLQNIDNTRMSLTGDIIREGIRQLAIQWLTLYKRFAKGYRVLDITGGNMMGSVVVWSAEDINSFDVEYDTENELRISEDAQRESFMTAYNMGLYTDENGVIPQRIKVRALELMKAGKFTELMGEYTLQAKYAQRENSLFTQGVIPQINEFDDDDIHVAEHTKVVLQYDFELKRRRDPARAEMFMKHIRDHESRIAQKKQQQQAQAALAQLAQKNKGGM